MSSKVDGKTLADAYLRRVEMAGNDTAHFIKRNGTYEPKTWNEIHKQVLGIFQSLRKLGIQKGDRICLLSTTRSEWNITDLACLCSGVVLVPIYHSSLAEDVAYLINHCGAKLIVLENEAQADKVAYTFATQNKQLPVVSIDRVAPRKEFTPIPFEEFARPIEDTSLDAEFRKYAQTITPDTMASIVYTSGTTGKPKGAVLRHSNFMMELRAIIDGFQITSEDTTLTFLPLAHILGRVESLMPVISGLRLAFAESLNDVSKNIQEVKPTVLVAVPRIYEKINSSIQSQVASAPKFRQAIFNWALKVGKEYARMKSDQKIVPAAMLAKYRIADQLVFSKVRAKTGNRIRIAVSGGAPLSPELCQFFHACGIPIVEGYGLTETTAAMTVNRIDDFIFGTVGKPLGNTEIRLAPDGEIQVRGGLIFSEYYEDSEATRESLSPDGWFATGDIGEFVARGFLRITDRKKELIVTSAGKNVAPQKIENLLKGVRYISQGMVYGDKQKYLSALITLNEGETAKWAKASGLNYKSFAELTKNEKVFELIEKEIHAINKQLPSYETIKKFRILPSDFTIETGELTPSLKIKRKVCVQKYKSYIEEMY
jgi:long-chain acyl-CoA synthetase